MRGESTRLAKLLSIIFVSSVLFACGSSDPANDTANNVIESTFSKTTHQNAPSNNSMDCMSCHAAPASGGRPQFTTAGTVYTGPASNTIHPNARVEFYLDGQLFHSIPVSKSGTFFTNVSIPWGTNFTAKVKNTVSGTSSNAMLGGIPKYSYGCTGCHDVTQRLYGP